MSGIIYELNTYYNNKKIPIHTISKLYIIFDKLTNNLTLI